MTFFYFPIHLAAFIEDFCLSTPWKGFRPLKVDIPSINAAIRNPSPIHLDSLPLHSRSIMFIWSRLSILLGYVYYPPTEWRTISFVHYHQIHSMLNSVLLGISTTWYRTRTGDCQWILQSKSPHSLWHLTLINYPENQRSNLNKDWGCHRLDEMPFFFVTICSQWLSIAWASENKRKEIQMK